MVGFQRYRKKLLIKIFNNGRLDYQQGYEIYGNYNSYNKALAKLEKQGLIKVRKNSPTVISLTPTGYALVVILQSTEI